MTEFIKLQRKLRRFFGLNIEFNSIINNIQLNGIYVTHITEERYKINCRLLKEILDDLKIQIENNHDAAELILDELIKTRNEIKEVLLDDSYLFSSSFYKINEQQPIINPIPPQKFLEPGERIENREGKILDLIADFFNVEFYADVAELNVILCREKTFRGERITEEILDQIHAIGHLAYSLTLQVQSMTEFIEYFSTFFNFEEDDNFDSSTPSLSENLPEIEYNLNKIDIALFFEILYEEEIIKFEGRNEDERLKKLKRYIDSANISYYDDGEKTKVKKINKQFSMLRAERMKYAEKNEKMLLEDLINKFQKRLRRINEEPNLKKYS